MDAESSFAIMTAIVFSLVGGYLAGAQLNLWLWGGELERYVLPMLASLLSAVLGALFGLALFNAPLMLCFGVVWAGGVFYMVTRGLLKNPRRKS